MNRQFAAPGLAIRSVFAAAAVVITVSIGGFIDYLASGYVTTPHTSVHALATEAVALTHAVD
jgi:hypothetical protein